MTATRNTADETQLVEKLSPMRYRITQHGHLYLVTKRGSQWAVDRDDYKDMAATGTLRDAQSVVWDDNPDAGCWTWRSGQGVYHLMPATGPCATCGRAHQRGTGLTTAAA